MQAPGYVETNPSTIRYREYTLQLHKQKLKQIQKQSAGRLTACPGEMAKHSKAKPPPYHEIGKFHAERHAEIRRENQLLLDKLVEISHGKRPVNTPNISKILSAPQPKSLNINNRKKEALRIAAENEAMARRLMERSAHLSKKRLDMQYENAVKYKKQISKSYLFRRRTGSKMSLPPIRESKRSSPDKLTASGHRRHHSKKSHSPKEKRRNHSANFTERPQEKPARSSKSRLHPDKMSKDIAAKNGANLHESSKRFDYLNIDRPVNEELEYEELNVGIGSQTERISIKTRESFREYNEEGGHEEYVEDDYEDSFEDDEETHKTGETGSEERASQPSSKGLSLYKKMQESSSRGSLMRAGSEDNVQFEMLKPTEEQAESPQEYKLEVYTEPQLDKIPSSDEEASEAQSPSILESKADIEVPMAESAKISKKLSISIDKDLDSSVESDYMNGTSKAIQRFDTERVITEGSALVVEDASYIQGRFDESSRVSSHNPSFSSIKGTPKLLEKPSTPSKYEEYDEDFDSDVDESYPRPARNPQTSGGEHEIPLHSDRSDSDISQDGKVEHAIQASYNPRVIESPEEHEESSQNSDLSQELAKSISRKSEAEIETSQQSYRSNLRDSKQASIRQSSSFKDKSIEDSDIESSVYIPKSVYRGSKQEYENPIFSAHSSRRSSKPVSVKNSIVQENSLNSSYSDHTGGLNQPQAELYQERSVNHSSRRSSRPVSVKNSIVQENSLNSSKGEEEASKRSILEIENTSAKSSRRSSKKNSRQYNEDSVYSDHTGGLNQPQSELDQERSVNHSSRRSSKPVSVKNSMEYRSAPDDKSIAQLSSQHMSASVSREKIESSIINEIHQKSYQSEVRSHPSLSRNSSRLSNLKASDINEASPAADEPSFLSESKLFAKSPTECSQDFLSHPTSPIPPINLQDKFMDSSMLHESHRSDKLSIASSISKSHPYLPEEEV